MTDRGILIQRRFSSLPHGGHTIVSRGDWVWHCDACGREEVGSDRVSFYLQHCPERNED